MTFLLVFPLRAKRLPHLLDRFVLKANTPRSAVMMTLRIAVNLLSSDKGAALALKSPAIQTITEACATGLEHENPQVSVRFWSRA